MIDENLCRSPISISFRERYPPILALTIGINKYASPDFDDLTGAVGDADAFENFLKQRLNVPLANILSLRDEQASRDAIIDAFISLRDNPKYKRDEAAIIIFYAGHGAQTEKPEEWEDWATSTGKIEMLCPSDMGVSTEIDGIEYEDTVPSIPDRTISVLLNHISDVKGNNITMILDCCSSAGINRGETYPDGYVIRQIANPPLLAPNLDRKIWSRGMRGGGIAEGFSGKFHASHVLLAACGRDEFAREDPKTQRGLFTYSLLKVLENDDFQSLTYTSLMHKMKMPIWQTPHCEGQGVNWRLFNNKVSGADGSFILTKRDKENVISLEGGGAQGVTIGSRFAVHMTNLVETPNSPNPCRGYLVVTSVNAFSSTLEVSSTGTKFRPPRLFYSKLVQSAAKKLSLYCDDKVWLESIFPSHLREEQSIMLVDDVLSCDLQLSVINGRVHFDRHNALVTPHIGSRIRHTVAVEDIDSIHNVVRGTLHFYYHLTRSGPGDFKNVWMELKELKEEFSEDFDQILTPVGKNLIAEEPAKIVVDEFARLGMTIFNQTDLPLYPYLFYFDPTELSIIEWYTPPFGAGAGRLTTKVDVPLPPKSLLSIGYGDGGISPWQFVLPEGDTKDLGFFKLFLSTRPAYFASILQESPFEPSTSRAGKPTAPDLPEGERWAAQVVTVIQVDK